MTQASSRLALLDWLPAYRKEWLRFDLVAGLTTAAVVIPKAMAYATIAGLPVQVGLYTAFVPLIIYAVLGTSRPMSATTTTTIAILTGSALGEAVPGGDAATLLQVTALLTLMVGVLLIAASVLRLGFVANFISEPVLIGFKAGIGVVIVVDQVPKILGIHFAKGSFLHNVQAIGLNLSHASMVTLAVGAATILGLAAIEKFRPRWPAPLIVIALAITAVTWLGLQSQGVEVVGTIPAGLPVFSIPALALAKQLWPAALGIALMSFTETAAVGRAFATTDEPTPRPNVELFATGVANAVGAFLGSMPAGGGMSQTAVNRLTGARTQISGLVTAAMTLLTMLLLAPLLALMPHAVLAGVVIVYSIGLIKPADFRGILAIRRTEFFWAAAAFVGVMLLGTLKGILVAIIVSIVALAQQSANPPVHVLGRKRGTNVFRPRSPENPDDETFPGLLLLRPEGRMFFLNAEWIAERMRPLIAEAGPKVIVLDLSAVFDLEFTALKMLIEAEARQRATGVSFWLAGLNPDVLAVVQRSSLGKTLGREGLLHNVEIAVDNYRALRSGRTP
ncbi:MAG TPA: SulP family inorganic anion transporter [Steroidobacteraceae bacterium]|nr:SulP family inorganic anion transporter [Steroidobacteraceae bacterium]